MSLPRQILLSLGLNLILLGALAWKWHPVNSTVTHGTANGEANGEFGETEAEGDSGMEGNVPAPDAVEFHWSQLDTTSWATHRDGLLRMGCPGGTVREILEPPIRRLFAARVRVLVEPYFERFWDLVLPPNATHEKVLRAAVSALQEEEEALLKDLFRGLPEPVSPAFWLNAADEARLEFLSPDLRERALEVLESHRRKVSEFEQAHQGSQKELSAGLKALGDQLDVDLASFLNSEELDQLRMRQSPFAQLRELEGVNLSEAELAKLIRIREHAAGAATNGASRSTQSPEERKAINHLLGPERAAEFERAQSHEFRSLLQMTERLGAPADQARDLWAMHEAAEIIRDTRLPETERQSALTALRHELAARAEDILGDTRGRETWERAQRNWLDGTFQLPEDDPLASLPP